MFLDAWPDQFLASPIYFVVFVKNEIAKSMHGTSHEYANDINRMGHAYRAQ